MFFFSLVFPYISATFIFLLLLFTSQPASRERPSQSFSKTRARTRHGAAEPRRGGEPPPAEAEVQGGAVARREEVNNTVRGSSTARESRRREERPRAEKKPKEKKLQACEEVVQCTEDRRTPSL